MMIQRRKIVKEIGKRGIALFIPNVKSLDFFQFNEEVLK